MEASLISEEIVASLPLEIAVVTAVTAPERAEAYDEKPAEVGTTYASIADFHAPDVKSVYLAARVFQASFKPAYII